MSSKKLKKYIFHLLCSHSRKSRRSRDSRWVQAVRAFSSSPVGGHSMCHGFSKCFCSSSKRTCWGQEWLW